MKLLILADLHCVHYDDWINFIKIDKSSFDCILLLGDIDILYLKSISEVFKNKIILGVLGNHDNFGDLEYYDLLNIHNKVISFNNVSFLGVEGSVKYKKENAPMHSQEEVLNIINGIDYVDVVISHNSPKGVHDKNDIAHQGYEAITNYIYDKKPKVCLHGHQHINKVSKIGSTLIIGVYGGSILDLDTLNLEKVLDIY